MNTEVEHDRDMPTGWPLGLENMNTRLRTVDESLQTGETQAESFPFHVHSMSFSSFTSSDLDTVSTRSFFHDKSVPLGRLIRLKPGDGGDLYFTHSIRFGEGRQKNAKNSVPLNSYNKQKDGSSCGVCIPLLQNVLVKFSPNRNNSGR